MLVLLTIGLTLGLLLGVLGGGGSILTVPALVYGAGLEPKAAIATSLTVVGVTSAVGALRQWQSGTVQPRRALGFALATMLGAFGGGKLSAFVRGDVQLVVLALVMLGSAISMLRPPPATTGAPPRPGVLIAAGLGVGALTGVVGIGGGFLIVPALATLAAFPMAEAVGTSLVVIALNSATAFAALATTARVPWGVAATVTAAAIVGVLAGSSLGRRLSGAQIRRGFAIFLLVLAAFILWTNRATLGLGTPPAPAPSTTSVR
jgi:hypothetical protein